MSDVYAYSLAQIETLSMSDIEDEMSLRIKVILREIEPEIFNLSTKALGYAENPTVPAQFYLASQWQYYIRHDICDRLYTGRDMLLQTDYEQAKGKRIAGAIGMIERAIAPINLRPKSSDQELLDQTLHDLEDYPAQREIVASFLKRLPAILAQLKAEGEAYVGELKARFAVIFHQG